MTYSRLRAAGLVLVVLLSISACSTDSPGGSVAVDSADPTVDSRGTDSDVAVGGEPVAGSLTWSDGYETDTVAWGFVGSAYHGAVEVEWFMDLDEIIDASTAVIVGTVVGVGPAQTIVGDAEGDVVTIPSLEVRVDRLLAGELPPGDEPGGVILVQVLRVPPADRLPGEPAIFFLRYALEDVERYGAIPAPGNEGKYRLTSTQGLMIPDRDGSVRMPVFEAAYHDEAGSADWQGSDLLKLFEAVRGLTIESLMSAVEFVR